MKKILFVDCSPRPKGNCCIAVNYMSAQTDYAEVEIFRLREKQVNPCLGCDGCKRKHEARCVQKDDMAELVKRLDDFDAVVVVAPVYFAMVNGPAKTFLDRLYCYYDPAAADTSMARKKGKKGALLLTCGRGPKDSYVVHGEEYVEGLKVLGVTDTKVVVMNGNDDPGEIWEHEENQKPLVDIVNWLMK